MTIQLSEKMGRLGTESAFDVLARAQALAARGRSVINLGIGQPDFKTRAAHRRGRREGAARRAPRLHARPASRALREAIAADLRERLGVEVDPGQVVVVPGGKVTMFFAMLMFGEPGRRDPVPEPRLPHLRVDDRLLRRDARCLSRCSSSHGFSFAADDVLARITPRTRLLIVNSPANPTGGAVAEGELDQLVAGLARAPAGRRSSATRSTPA